MLKDSAKKVVYYTDAEVAAMLPKTASQMTDEEYWKVIGHKIAQIHPGYKFGTISDPTDTKDI